MRAMTTTVLGLLVVIASSAFTTNRQGADTTRLVEIRSYMLKAGTRDRFHQRFVHDALPMLQRSNVDVVAYGPSLHDSESYVLMRAFPSLEERQRSEDAFYGSEEWRKGPREATLADIETYTTVVLRFDAAALRALRSSGVSAR